MFIKSRTWETSAGFDAQRVGPGFLPKELPSRPDAPDQEVRFLYAGALAYSHGIDLLLESLKHMPERGWHLTIAGQGPLTEQVIRLAQYPQWRGKVEYLQPMRPDAFERLLGASHVGLNCQRKSDPISGVTFPSKIFTYFSAGLVVLSSKASAVEELCGNACFYYEEETPQSLGRAMKELMTNFLLFDENLTWL